MLEPAWIGFLFFFFGAIFGSFATVLVVRIPKGENIAWPGSHCRECNAPIRWYDNVPIFGYLALLGRCRKCKVRIPIRYLIIELTMASLFLALYLKVGMQWLLLEYLLFAFALVVSTFIDLEHLILPDVFTLSGIVIGLIGAALNPDRSFYEALWGVLIGGGFLWAVAYIYLVLRKQEGMGGGDIKLIAWIGALLGWKAIPFVIISSSLLGSIVGIAVASRSKSGFKQVIPFGPFLAAGALLYIFIDGQKLSDWYMQLHGLAAVSAAPLKILVAYATRFTAAYI